MTTDPSPVVDLAERCFDIDMRVERITHLAVVGGDDMSYDMFEYLTGHLCETVIAEQLGLADAGYDSHVGHMGETMPLPNVWMGASIESDPWSWRAKHVRSTIARVRFLSLEPLIGPLPSLQLDGIDWVIVGGESGPQARPMHPDWVRDLRDRCGAAGVPFFFKQAGAVLAREWGCSHRAGGIADEWPEEFRVREYPLADAVSAGP